ncbi:MAG: hypothetical protein ACREQF_04235, partial [Candidatus Binataceae bacterium]
LSTDPVESFRLFQGRVLDIYDQLAEEFGLKTVDATGDIPSQQKQFRKMVQDVLRDYDRHRAQQEYGTAIQAR